jgi:hypothetical protein
MRWLARYVKTLIMINASPNDSLLLFCVGRDFGAGPHLFDGLRHALGQRNPNHGSAAHHDLAPAPTRRAMERHGWRRRPHRHGVCGAACWGALFLLCARLQARQLRRLSTCPSCRRPLTRPSNATDRAAWQRRAPVRAAARMPSPPCARFSFSCCHLFYPIQKARSRPKRNACSLSGFWRRRRRLHGHLLVFLCLQRRFEQI